MRSGHARVRGFHGNLATPRWSKLCWGRGPWAGRCGPKGHPVTFLRRGRGPGTTAWPRLDAWRAVSDGTRGPVQTSRADLAGPEARRCAVRKGRCGRARVVPGGGGGALPGPGRRRRGSCGGRRGACRRRGTGQRRDGDSRIAQSEKTGADASQAEGAGPADVLFFFFFFFSDAGDSGPVGRRGAVSPARTKKERTG